MPSNKKLGNDFEQEVCKKLADRGFWVHNFANRANGQPADMIAVKNGLAYLIDAKVVSGKRFQVSRIEENQVLAMKKWFNDTGLPAGFCFKLSDGTAVLVMLPDEWYLDKLLQFSSITEDEIREMGEQL